MAKRLYFGIADKARKGKKAYIGIDGKARKIKKMYFGVGGKARCFFASDLVYGGTATSLSTARTAGAAGRAGTKYLLISGGYAGSNVSGLVEAFNASLTKTSATNLNYNYSYYEHRGLSIGDYVVFAGGGYNSENNYACAYNSSLTRTDLANWGSGYGGRGQGAGNAGTSYAIFACGGANANAYNLVKAYNASLTLNTNLTLTARYDLGGGGVGNYAVFAGGCYKNLSSAVYSTVETVNNSLTKGTATSLSGVRTMMGSANAGKYLLFGGGANNLDESIKTVEAYNTSLTKSSVSALSENSTQNGSYYPVCASIDEFATFSGGKTGIINIYDGSLVKKTNLTLKTIRGRGMAGNIGDYLLIAGGSIVSDGTSGDKSAVVEYLKI